MPHRILSSEISLLLETVLLGLVAGWHATLALLDVLSEKDWTRLLGEDGFKAALLIGIAVVWSRAERSKDERHRELVSALAVRDQKDDHRMDQFIKLTERVVGTIQAFDSNNQRLVLRVEDLADQLREKDDI